MFKSRYQKLIESQVNLIHGQVRDVVKHMLESTMKMTEMLLARRYDEARGYSSTIVEQLSLSRRMIETYMTQSLKKIFETNADFSFSLEAVQNEKTAVFRWFDEIREQIRDFQERLGSKDDEKIQEGFSLLLQKIGYDERLTDFVNTLIALQTEHTMHLINENKGELASLFSNLRFHPIVKKASEKLFKDGHYAQAIFEACKALSGFIREKSKLTTTKDSDLMWQAFGIQYSINPLRITKRPVLSLNSLTEEWEFDEQKGFANLFSGTIMGIRNPKAHKDIIQKNPYKTLEYLSLISLLARRTDEATLNI
jgi:uncharacterized protein (TIGR02391 family)